jgi:hypothetical protein
MVRSKKLGELAAEFDSIHSRARRRGHLGRRVLPASALRAELIETVERRAAGGNERRSLEQNARSADIFSRSAADPIRTTRVELGYKRSPHPGGGALDEVVERREARGGPRRKAARSDEF